FVIARRKLPKNQVWPAITERLSTTVDDAEFIGGIADDLVAGLMDGEIESRRVLELLEKAPPNPLFEEVSWWRYGTSLGPTRRKRIPVQQIVARCYSLPPVITELAWEVGAMQMAKPTPVTTIAKKQGWFTESTIWDLR
ncbi:hypothetical protein K7G98_32005, partial [Saccharothrix sp. MB29]|nr:hypothetical protein [Saccharothrix sp. MB29]